MKPSSNLSLLDVATFLNLHKLGAQPDIVPALQSTPGQSNCKSFQAVRSNASTLSVQHVAADQAGDRASSARKPRPSVLARTASQMQAVGRSLRSQLSGKSSHKFALTGQTGSLLYMSPEVRCCRAEAGRIGPDSGSGKHLCCSTCACAPRTGSLWEVGGVTGLALGSAVQPAFARRSQHAACAD